MAFIPDELTVEQRKLSGNARLVFEAHCRYRIHKYRVSFATNNQIAEAYGLSIGSVRNAMTELRNKGWLRSCEKWTEFLVGDFSPVDKNHPLQEIPAGPLFARALQDARAPLQETIIDDHETMITAPEAISAAHETMIENHGTVIDDHETMIDDHETVIAHNKDHARGPSQASQASHTQHTPPPAAEEKACVRVCPFSLFDLKRYAKANGLRGGWINDVLNETSKFDAQIADWLKEQCAPGQSEQAPALLDPKRCPDCNGTNFYYPAGPAAGVAKCPHDGLLVKLKARAETETDEARGSPPAAVG